MEEIQHQQAPKAKDFYQILLDKDRLIAYLMNSGIISKSMVCTVCTNDMNLINRKDVSDAKQWKCPVCLSTF